MRAAGNVEEPEMKEEVLGVAGKIAARNLVSANLEQTFVGVASGCLQERVVEH